MTVTAVIPTSTDLGPIRVDTAGMPVNSRTLELSGWVDVTVTNYGSAGFDYEYDVLIFEDLDFDGLYTPGIDAVLGEQALSEVPGPDAGLIERVFLTGRLLFKDNLVHAYVDVEETLPEKITRPTTSVRASLTVKPMVCPVSI